MNDQYTDINVEAVLQQGDKAMQAKHAEGEKEKLGNLRGGDSGCVHQGEVYGCHRSSVARALGYDIPPDPQSMKYFTAGYGIEDQIALKFQAGWPHQVLREEEIPVSWQVNSGRLVTGRPDFVLAKDGVNLLGVELKTIVSTSMSKQIGLKALPSTKHLCQAAHYSWQHEIPWVLTYVSPAVHNTTNNAVKGAPKGTYEYPGRYYLKIEPFHKHFYLRFDGDVVVYQDPHTGRDVRTIITKQGLKDYYELIDECLEKKTLYFPPVNRYADGSKMPFEHIRYCKACTAAEKAHGDWQHWLDELSIIIEERKALWV